MSAEKMLHASFLGLMHHPGKGFMDSKNHSLQVKA